MAEPVIINKQGPIDSPYIAGLNGVTIGLYASSLYAAKQKAIEYFRPKKKEVNLLWVEFAGVTEEVEA